MCLFHKWDYIYDYGYRYFLGEPIKYYYKAFKVCRKCGKVKRTWSLTTLSNEEKEILLSKLVIENGMEVIKRTDDA